MFESIFEVIQQLFAEVGVTPVSPTPPQLPPDYLNLINSKMNTDSGGGAADGGSRGSDSM